MDLLISNSHKKIKEFSPQSLVIIQSHGGLYPDSLSFHAPEEGFYEVPIVSDQDEYVANKVPFDAALAHQMQKSLHDYEKKTQVLEEPYLPHTAAILQKKLQTLGVSIPRMVVLSVSLEGSQQHYEYGSLIARALHSDSEKVMVIAIGQLSHCLSEESNAGYVPFAHEYDEEVLRYLSEQDYSKFMLVDPFLIQDVGEDLYRPLCFCLGVFDALQNPLKWNQIAYETPQGIGSLYGYFSRED